MKRSVKFSLLILAVACIVSVAQAQTGTPCNQFGSGAAAPSGYGAAWNPLTSARELLISAGCQGGAGSTVTYSVGGGASTQYAYKIGYYYSASWKPFTLTGTFAQGSTDWIIGKGTYTHTDPPAADYFFVGYVCHYQASSPPAGGWKCGCRDSACSTPMWQLQQVKYPVSGNVQTVTVGADGANVRSCAGTSCTLLGNQPSGATGKVIGGPVAASGDEYWNVDYTTGVDGWSAASYITLSAGGTTGGTEGIAAKYPRDQGIQNHPSVVYYNNFESATFDPSWGHYPADRPPVITTNAAAVHNGSRGLQVMSNMWKRWTTGGDFKVLYMRYYQKIGGPAAEDSEHNGGYIVGCASACPPGDAGHRADGTNKFLANLETSLNDQQPDYPLPGKMASYTYHVDAPGIYGQYFRSEFFPQLDRWYAVEYMVRMNTIGKADGELRAWVDGKQILSKTGLRWRTVESLAIDKIGFLDRPRLYIDDLVVATEYIGPMKP